MSEKKPKRLLLKLSGEALMGDLDYGIDPAYIKRIASEIKTLVDLEYEVAVVIGGGNIFRGAGLAEAGVDRVTGDHMGMLATVINSLSLQDALEHPSIALERYDAAEPYARLVQVPCEHDHVPYPYEREYLLIE